MVYIIPVICILSATILLWIGGKAFNREKVLTSIVALLLGVIMAVASLAFCGNAYYYIDYKANEATRQEWRIEERAVLTTMLSEITTLMEHDVTASNTYMEIYNSVLDFNRNVREANTWSGTMWEGILCDPSYAELDVIPLN